MVSVTMSIPDEWVEAADERNLSNTEYTRRMVRAGRRQFGYDYESSETPASPKTLKHNDNAATDIESHLKEWVLTNLSTTEAQDIDDLVDLLEDDLAKLADELCDQDKAKYRRTEGGYLKINE